MRFRYFTKEKLEKIPKAPGVYALSGVRKILYIGKAGNLRERMKNHFQQPSYRDHFFIEQAERIGYIETESEIEALLLESQFIKNTLPKYNVMWKDDKKYLFVGITEEQLPRVFLTHQPTRVSSSLYLVSGIKNKKIQDTKYKIQNTTYIGPFVDGKALKRTLRMLRRVFPYYTVRKHAPRPCQYCHLGLCPGPNPDTTEYRKRIKNLAAVLEGKRTSVLKNLRKEMKEASREQDFEKAAKLRDQIHDLEIIFSHARVFRPEEEKMPLNWEQTEAYLRKILRTKGKISRVEAYDISNIQGKEATGSMPVFIDGKPAKDQYRKFKIHIAGKANDFAMLQEVIGRRLAHPEWPYPDLMIIDGGKGQLTAALRAVSNFQFPISNFQTNPKSQILKLKTINYQLSTIKVAAIAKKHNELFLPGQPKPLLLKDMPQQVSNFILHIRDEAHRFAILYHRKLRRKKFVGQY